MNAASGPTKTGIIILAMITIVGFAASPARPQQMSNVDRGQMEDMLKDVSDDIQKHYYDKTFHGLDWNAQVRDAKEKISKENSLNMSMAHIAAALVALNDSHTFLLPPPRPFKHDYGFRMLMVGDSCYIDRVRPGSDAEAKGLKRGDQILAFDSIRPTRDIMWKIDYRYRILRPQPGVQVALRHPDGQQGQVDVLAKFRETSRMVDLTDSSNLWNLLREDEAASHLMRAQSKELGDALMILKLPEFIFQQDEIDKMIGKARKHQALILDLRGNPGGAVDTLKYLLGDIFPDEVKIADRVGRKDMKPEVAKGRGDHAFAGKLEVLIDSQSGSAAEIFARVIQLQKRGSVIGDRSSGSVMEAKHYDHKLGSDTIVPYGVSITDSDLIMSDGKSLEHVGVTPDELVLPTAADMASARDPVLSHAADVLGVKLSPEDAGKLFPFEWPRE